MAEALVVAGGTSSMLLTEADEAAIEELQDLGFGRHFCIDAYLSEDKNKDMAANFLLEYAFV